MNSPIPCPSMRHPRAGRTPWAIAWLLLAVAPAAALAANPNTVSIVVQEVARGACKLGPEKQPSVRWARCVEIDASAIFARTPGGPLALELSLPDRSRHHAERLDFDFRHPADHCPQAWVGGVGKLREPTVVLTLCNARAPVLVGSIREGKRTLRIRPAGSGNRFLHILEEAEVSAIRPGEAPVVSFKGDDRKQQRLNEFRQRTGTTIDVAVLYTRRVNHIFPSIAAQIQAAIDEGNAVLRASAVPARFRLVMSEELPRVHDERDWLTTTPVTGGILALRLGQLRDGQWTEIQQRRNASGADLVVLAVTTAIDTSSEFNTRPTGLPNGMPCGIANGLLSADGDPSAAFAFVAPGCLLGPAYGMIHELAHNFGTHHDRVRMAEVGERGGLFPDSRGFADPANDFTTVMAYPTACRDTGRNCDRVPYYSNPQVLYQGHPTGIAAPSPEAADNVRTLTLMAPVVGGYRDALVDQLTIETARFGKLPGDNRRTVLVRASSSEAPGAALSVTIGTCLNNKPLTFDGAAQRYELLEAVDQCGNLVGAPVWLWSSQGGAARALVAPLE